MQTLYRLNADELNNEFLESIKILFSHKTIEVVIHAVDEENQTLPAAHFQSSPFSPLPTRLKLIRDELDEGKPDYLTMKVDEIVMPSREDRYER